MTIRISSKERVRIPQTAPDVRPEMCALSRLQAAFSEGLPPSFEALGVERPPAAVHLPPRPRLPPDPHQRSVPLTEVRSRLLGSHQTTRFQEARGRLSEADHARFNSLLRSTDSELKRTYLKKALACGYSVSELEIFAGVLARFPYDEELIATLTLRNATQSRLGTHSGLQQQYGESCVVNAVQVVRGELDPIYALSVRLSNPDIHVTNEESPETFNTQLSVEQKDLLDRAGGVAVPIAETEGGRGLRGLGPVLNTFLSDALGTKMLVTPMTGRKALQTAADQLQVGIPTILGIFPKGFGGHTVAVLDVRGEGEEQSFLIHDSAPDSTQWVCAKSLLQGDWTVKTVGCVDLD